MTPAYKPERARQQGSVHRIPAEFVTRLRLMLIWEARLQAREIVKRKLKAEGVRVSLLSASTITRHADKYLLSLRRRTKRKLRPTKLPSLAWGGGNRGGACLGFMLLPRSRRAHAAGCL